IEDVNDVPTGVTSSSHIVSSATPQGQNFAVLTCMDEDINNVHTFTLIDDSGGRFTIFQNHLQVAQPLDVSVTHTRTIIVKCSDGMAESLPIQIDIQVTASIGNADIDISLNAHTVDENKPANTFVGLFTARSNAYPSDSFTFDLLDSDNGAFVLQLVGSSSANLLTNRLLNYEDEASHSITVQANGQHGMAVKTFMVTVTDVNEPPTYLSLHNTVVQENINNALVGIVTAQDPEGDAIDFEITQDPTGSFQLLTTGTPNTKRLVTTRALDYESELSLTVAIRAKEILDDTKTSESVVFAVNVIDVNEAPNMIRLDRNTISETATSGDIVGPLMITDPDSAHYLQHFTCILRDDANGIFGMNGLNLVVADHAVLDYEGVANHELTVDVECQDQRKLSHKETLTVIVTDVNERPTDIKSASGLFKVKENQNVGEVVAYLITEDPDNTHQDSFTYTVSPMDSMAIMSDQLITHRQLNFEEKSTHEVTLTVTDEGGLTLTKVVTVEVVDTNDPPTAIVIPTGTAVYENSPTDTLVAELATIDEDIGQSYTYTLESHQPRGSLKLVDGNKLMIDDGSIVNYETVQFLEATIITTDNGTPSPLNFVETLQIPILDVNEPPRSMTLASNKVVENPVDRALVGEIYVDDPDSFQQSFMCGLTSDEGNRFELEHNGSTIRLLVGNGLLFDYEAATYHDIIIDCHDTDHQSPVSGSFRILILNANDKPSGVFVIDADPDDTTIDPNRPEEDEDIFGNVVTASIATVKEDASPGLGIVAYVFVTDEDNLNDDSQRQTHSCELISEWEYNNSTAEDQLSERRRRRRQISNTEQPPSMGSDEIPTQFMIQSGTNSIVVREVLDYEENNEYLIYLRCRDNGNPSMSVVSSVKIIVLDVDEAPLDIGLSTLTMLENSPEDTLVAHIGLVDPDGTMTAHAYEIISLGVPYYIKDKELRVSRTPIDHEITPVWTVQIRVQEVNTDLEIVKNFDITIDNVNEPPDSLIINGDTSVVVMETADVNSEVGTLESHDPDELDTEFGFAFYGDHPSHDYFNIIDDKLLIKQQLDAWEMDMHELTIEVTDSGGLSYIGKITLRLTAVNRCNESDYCSVYAQCIHSVCTCMPGFMGNGFTCTDIDNCDPNPCHPDNTIGDCQDGFGGLRNFTCNCKMGWLGPDCYREVNDCFNNSCNSLGTSKCVDKLNDYVCECKSGYTGQYCEVNIDDCLTNECLNGGQCIDGINGYICDCKEPYQGINCDTDASICYDVSCPHNGTCIPYSHGKNYACRCLEPFSPDCEGCMYGYGGDNCQP
uniref:Cadherin EGF LAG seven-pass G-type receptor 3-like n=1 Tax=Saccoglossus kowalevskii TaxID=10224 RepID=A0ABM0GNQ3_SACKO